MRAKGYTGTQSVGIRGDTYYSPRHTTCWKREQPEYRHFDGGICSAPCIILGVQERPEKKGIPKWNVQYLDSAMTSHKA